MGLLSRTARFASKQFQDVESRGRKIKTSGQLVAKQHDDVLYIKGKVTLRCNTGSSLLVLFGLV